MFWKRWRNHPPLSSNQLLDHLLQSGLFHFKTGGIGTKFSGFSWTKVTSATGRVMNTPVWGGYMTAWRCQRGRSLWRTTLSSYVWSAGASCRPVEDRWCWTLLLQGGGGLLSLRDPKPGVLSKTSLMNSCGTRKQHQGQVSGESTYLIDLICELGQNGDADDAVLHAVLWTQHSALPQTCDSSRWHQRLRLFRSSESASVHRLLPGGSAWRRRWRSWRRTHPSDSQTSRAWWSGRTTGSAPGSQTPPALAVWPDSWAHSSLLDTWVEVRL